MANLPLALEEFRSEDAGDPDGIERAYDARWAARMIAEQLQDDTERLYQRLKHAMVCTFALGHSPAPRAAGPTLQTEAGG
ncbi:MAG: hypothetical protein LC749_08480 [Actinobacteria bacterium]|nr:hypothetical protein [Actinomycetota bacterium]